MRKLKNIYRCIKNGIRNIIRWFPVIWQDRDWEDDFIYILLKKKIENMEKSFRSIKALSVNASENADNMRHAIILLDRIINDVYIEEAMKPFYEKYPNYEFELKFKPCEDKPGLKMIDEDTLEQKKLRYKCYEESNKLKEKDFDELFNFLREHIREWWD